ncbi:MAG: hypothetical protein JWO46_1497 [Nocardioidaceae bacterium]|nr:hypothetical protein [Nocardioidaceae bacterium]
MEQCSTASPCDHVHGSQGALAPAPWAHAYEVGIPRTVCGLTVADLHWSEFVDTAFDDVEWAVKCDTCRDLLVQLHRFT